MPYKYFDDIAIADVAFEATGKTMAELFIAAADALTNVMIEDLNLIEPLIEHNAEVQSETFEMLLFEFLQELIFLKDAKQLLFRVDSLDFKKENDKFILKAVLKGETLDNLRHPLNVDVKAVTFHRYKVEETPQGWRAFVVLDI